MPQTAPASCVRPGGSAALSPLMLCDRLLTLAQDADLCGYATIAEQLLRLAYEALDKRNKSRLAA